MRAVRSRLKFFNDEHMNGHQLRQWAGDFWFAHHEQNPCAGFCSVAFTNFDAGQTAKFVKVWRCETASSENVGAAFSEQGVKGSSSLVRSRVKPWPREVCRVSTHRTGYYLSALDDGRGLGVPRLTRVLKQKQQMEVINNDACYKAQWKIRSTRDL